MTAEAVVFGSGRPTILLPELSEVVTLDHVAIAWDGSRVAARAVADAGFLLRRVSRISVITVLDEKPLAENDAGERLAGMLRERGLNAQSVSINAQVSTAEQNPATRRRKSRPLGGASGERREGVARPEFPACGVGDFGEGFSLPFGRGFGRDGSFRRSSRGC